ncbi:hypothetical protein [Mycolicibacterium brumae]|uniref:Secreted protein n=1 Tax=Mycolicibacterium brumae TaxID=85968 RepID=A0A2G5P9E0_9MYCO|nr:hypothetical protein [Mycolicibacterium brumae]MCV7193997.1 hypothetical protein [Mycolicibacterium brumae]PIB74945.1 hypothetical protein CQY22_011320 [Mycolicibacterium brumae]RWA22425.1 hypothetical protein MBRU_12650 [Mycolicibacterium brumae DSM 44177]UWW08047.1 hypothetical protein L2Z93_001088 [Mycolicibacterium brumae]
MGITSRAACALTGAAALALTGAGTAAAAEDIPVHQVPATGTAVSGLAVPGPWTAALRVMSTDTPGEVELSVPVTPEICATTAGNALVRVDYANPGQTHGAAFLNPCGHAVDPAPVTAVVRTESGFTHFTTTIIGSQAYPNAGLPATMGTGSFVTP